MWGMAGACGAGDESLPKYPQRLPMRAFPPLPKRMEPPPFGWLQPSALGIFPLPHQRNHFNYLVLFVP